MLKQWKDYTKNIETLNENKEKFVILFEYILKRIETDLCDQIPYKKPKKTLKISPRLFNQKKKETQENEQQKKPVKKRSFLNCNLSVRESLFEINSHFHFSTKWKKFLKKKGSACYWTFWQDITFLIEIKMDEQKEFLKFKEIVQKYILENSKHKVK